MICLDLFKNINSVQIVGDHKIEQGYVNVLLIQNVEGCRRVVGFKNLQVFASEMMRQLGGNPLFIIHHQNG